MEIINKISIRELSHEDAEELNNLLNSASSEYSRYFTAFSFNLQTINNLLISKQKDLYFGIYLNDKLIGFYMLRGFDKGFDIPSYGVWIAPQFSKTGIASFSLYHCFCLCKINNVKKLMLKVYPDNERAKSIYNRAGFMITGQDEKNGNLIMTKTFSN